MSETISQIAEPEIQGEPQPNSATRVLIVEDDNVTRHVLEKRLSKNGYEVISGEDGERGLELATLHRPDIILSDWMMPKMDGAELCARIKSIPELQTTYFILLTAKDSNEDKVAALDTGADEYLVKPIEATELMARLRAAERIVALQKTLEDKNLELNKAMDRINRELQVVSGIQLDLLPQELPEIADYEFAAYYRPSTECSGDYYDWFKLGEDRYGILMADVSGHGTPAMVAMALARGLYHLFAPKAESAAALQGEINRLMFKQLPTNQYLTSFYGVLDTRTGQFQYCSAGHNPPLLIRAGGAEAQYLTNCEGYPIKLIAPDAEYENFETTLGRGDSLLLYTDGIPEGANADFDQFESERLSQSAVEAASGTAEAVLENIIENLLEFTAGTALNDDVSMFLVRRSA